MATLETRLIALASAVGADIKQARIERGDITALSTVSKTNLVTAINEVLSVATAAAGGGVSINDAAGNGATTVTWSADKIYDELVAAIAALRVELTAGAGAALDTFAELAAALGNDPSFAATIATGLANRVRVDAPQTFTAPQQAQGRSNIGAASAADLGNTDADLVATYTLART
jgi:hypothetical protein